MAVEITMPQLSDTMDKGTILTWHKKEGDMVKRGEALAEVATDKADLEIESFHEGKVLQILSPAGTTVTVGAVIAVIGDAGETSAKISQPQVAVKSTTQVVNGNTPNVSMETSPQIINTPSAISSTSDERIKISPLAKNIAAAHGVDYTDLSGTGEGGRIVRRDIEQKLNTTSPSSPPQSIINKPEVVAKPTTFQTSTTTRATTQLSKMRETIAARMVESTTTTPHFFVTARLVVDSLVSFRETLKKLPAYEGITFNHLVIKAAGLALAKFPRINAAFIQNAGAQGVMVQPAEINVGIITALPDGLLIPVVKRADQLSLADLVGEANQLVQRARSGRPKADDLVGGTFSISNIGKFEVEHFSAIINPGQGGILAVSSIQEEAVVKDGQVVAGKVMRLTLSVDHRIIDGVVAGEFLQELKRLLEEPILLIA